MKMVFILLIAAASVHVQAQTISFGKSSPGCDSHVVAQGETLYSIAKKYHTTVDQLLGLNPSITNNALPAGKAIKVPVVKDVIIVDEPVSGSSKKIPVMHSVEKSETLYSISKKFNVDVETMKSWNHLSDNSIKAGEEIIVGYESPKMNVIGPLPIDESWLAESAPRNESRSESVTDSTQEVVQPKIVSEKNTPTVHHTEKGLATWTHSNYDDGNFYALHPTAPIGTEIAVENIMNGKLVMVKVVGRLPAGLDNENIQIKISESAARKLNVLDEKFLVVLKYSTEERLSTVGIN